MKPIFARTLHVGDEEVAVISLPLAAAGSDSALTAAELDVTVRVLRGDTNAAIGHGRGTSVRTVANQLTSIFRKFGVTSRTELIALFTAPRPGIMHEEAP